MRKINVWLLAAVALLASLLLTACGSGGKGGTTGGIGGSGTGSGSIRNAAVHSALAAFAAIPRSTVDAENQAMLAYFHKNSEFVDSGITDQNVWAICKDATRVFMINNRQVVDNSDGTRAARAQITRLAIDVPSSKTAHVINNYGNGNAGTTSKITAMLRAGGYTVSTAGGSIAELKQPAGDGIFYLDTHGATKIEKDGTTTFYLMASDVYDENNTKNYDADLKSGVVEVLGEKYPVRQPDGTIKDFVDGHYGLSSRFAAAKWNAHTFGQNSFVFINACLSGGPNGLREICLAKGASVFAGWAGSVLNDHAVKVGLFVFDRMLGAGVVEKEADGPQRPFDYTMLAGDLSKHGLAADMNGVTLTLAQNPGTDFGLLAPTISFMDVNEFKNELTIHGIFGTDQSVGKVTVDGAEIAIRGWGFNSLVCDLPPGLAGDTIVEVRGHKSNVVQLTEWKAHFKTRFEQEIGSSLVQVGFLDVNFRADVHSYREQPHQKPLETTVLFNQEQDSTGQFTASGVKTDVNGMSETWSGTAILQVFGTNPAPKNPLVCFGSIDVKSKKIDIALQATAFEGMFSTKTPDNVPEPLPGLTGRLDSETMNGDGAPTLHLTLNDDFSINGGVREEIVSGNALHYRLEWDKIVPTSKPDEKAARSVKSKRAR